MSWADLLIDMDVLFVLPALPVAGFLVWQAACSAARMVRSVEVAGRSGSIEATMPYGRQSGSASQFHRI